MPYNGSHSRYSERRPLTSPHWTHTHTHTGCGKTSCNCVSEKSDEKKNKLFVCVRPERFNLIDSFSRSGLHSRWRANKRRIITSVSLAKMWNSLSRRGHHVHAVRSNLLFLSNLYLPFYCIDIYYNAKTWKPQVWTMSLTRNNHNRNRKQISLS